MKALVVTCRDPFRPSNNRALSVVRRRRSLRNLAPRTTQPVICQVNGKWISRSAWARRACDGDSIVFVVLPQGGGGGGGSNPLKVVLSLALMIAAPTIGAWANAQLFAAESSFAFAMSNSMLGSVIGFGINTLVSAVVGTPKATQAQQAVSLAEASPTYSLTAQGNQARIGSPIPVVYGRHIVYPDFAAMPYVEYSGNEQYLYQLMCIGQGEYEIEAIRIEDTPISGFSEIDYEIVRPGGTVTMFPANVVTSTEVSGQEALTSTTLGPFVANAATTEANYLAIDVVMSRGLYYANDSGGLNTVSCSWIVEAQQIDDNGVAVGAWFTLGSESHSAATTTPQRLSYRYSVTNGRYQVRLTRTDTKNTDSRYGHELDWAGLRSYLPGSQQYGGVTLVAMRMRATNNLSSQASRKVNLIVTRKLPIWNPTTGWGGPVATRSPAWAIADMARAEYGGELPDSRVALQSLYDLSLVWAARGDTFNAVYDSQSTVMEAMTQAARAGRAIAYQQGGVSHVVRDAPATIPVAMFTQRNIIKNSLKIDYLMPSDDTADDIIVTYFDEVSWTERTVQCTLPGSLSEKPATVKLFGVTSRQQAWQEGMYLAACNRYRRRFPTFSTEMEGFIPTIADLVAVSHYLPRWGQSGEIVSWDPATKLATLSEPLDWSTGGTHLMCFRKRDGSPSGAYVCTAGDSAYRVVLTSWNASSDPTPDTGDDRERAHFAFGPANEQYIRCRMVAMRPKSAETVEIAAVIESDYVHTADTGVAPDASAWQLPTKITAPVVSSLLASSDPMNRGSVILSWPAAAGAEKYIVEQSPNGIDWEFLSDRTENQLSTPLAYGVTTHFRVAGIALVRGPWCAISYQKFYSTPESVVNLRIAVNGNMATITMDAPADKTLGASGRLHLRHTSAQTAARWEDASPTFYGQPVTSVSVPLMSGTYLAKYEDSFGKYSDAPASIINTITNAMISMNVVDSISETGSWLGLHARTIVDSDLGGIKLIGTETIDSVASIDDVIDIDALGGIVPSGSYQPSSRIDLGRQAVCRLSSSLESMTFSPADRWDSRVGFIDSWTRIDNTDTDAGEAFIEIRKSMDGVDFGDWDRLVSGDHVFHSVEARVAMVTSDPNVNVLVRAFGLQVDMPDLLQQAADVVAAAGPLHIQFDTDFRIIPAIAISAQGMTTGDYYEITNKSTGGFDIAFFNASGTAISRTFDWIAKGY